MTSRQVCMMSLTAFDVSQAIAAQFSGCQDSRAPDTPLHIAAYEGDTEKLNEILSKRRSKEAIDQRNHLGCTPLRLAATGGHTECVERLLSAGASVDIADVKGQTPLHVAVKNVHYQCVQLLLQGGAEPSGHGDNRATPLSVAAMLGRSDLVQLLLAHKAEIVVQRRGASGMTYAVDPIQLAIAYHHFDCLRLLLAAGGQPVYNSTYTGVSSPFHTVVIQQCGGNFAQLLYEFGMRLWVLDSKDHLPWEVEPRSKHAGDDGGTAELMSVFERLRGEPRPLKSSCRLTVWRHIRSMKKTAAALKDLSSVPHSMLQYLMFEQV